MTDDDPLRTRREVVTPLAAELAVAGFEDAVEIGRGGFGVVYRCWQPGFDRMVAVKVLTAELDADNQARFVREQRAMGRLTGHPNIVTVLEAGVTESGSPFLVMPYHPRDSLGAWIRKNGPLAVQDVLRIGVKVAGALASAHRLNIVHRDVKPGNILLTEYGEPALTDFGIAHIVGGFQTSAGTLTGSPAFTAPEVLEGETPTSAADVYGLGATLFCALTGHAAFERRSGENVVTQFLRITTQPVPDLRASGIPDDVSALVSTAMSRDRRERPSATKLGEAIQQIQQRRGSVVSEMAVQGEPILEHRRRTSSERRSPASLAAIGGGSGGLPLELTSFVGRRVEMSEVKNRLATSRLVTLTGTGGVGKTRLALRAATRARGDFADGVCLVDLAEVSDGSLLVDVMAATLGVRDESARPLREVLIEVVSSREALLVLDNCEQIVEAVAELVEALLRTCPDVRVLATSREPLNIAGEAVLRVLPLTVPDPHRKPMLLGLPRFDAVTLFIERAAAAVPGFELDEDNSAAVAEICAHLDGLPLAIELAAARMRTLSPQQVLARLVDRYTLLTRGSRTAPTRQQTLQWCIDWSYQLCTPVEQRLWARLSIFAGSFDLDAIEQICGIARTADSEPDASEQNALDALSSLVDKSILIREASGAVVRFRMLETLRAYGWQRLHGSGEYEDLRRRHRNWYQQLALDAETEWVSDRQPEWLARLDREQPNLREALESCLSEDSDEAAVAGLRTTAALFEFWSFRGLYGEGRSWLDRILAHPRAQSIPHRVGALCVDSQMAALQGDFESARTLLAQGRTVAEQAPAAAAEARIAYAEGILALTSGEPVNATAAFERVVEASTSNRAGTRYISALMFLAWAYELRGETTRAIELYRQVLSLTEVLGELHYRSGALRGLGVAAWQQGERFQARKLLEEALRVNRRLKSPYVIAFSLAALAWTVADDSDAERAAVLLGAAEGLWPAGSNVRRVFPNLARFHDECERATRHALGARGFDSAFRRGHEMGMDAAVAYALGEPTGMTPASNLFAKLTKRERQVADLVARGLSNKQIAAELVISQRTAQGHVEHILTKLGFTSRAQIAACVAEEAQRESL
ncbi:protein kinase domain-containing protein [Nocardia sp. bgisy134]|uniref:protein kinase domain-containing protein n=1 Tax=Nocardia sp. bgisy134 TaxID=3413789 RepID=UPI003D70D5BE